MEKIEEEIIKRINSTNDISFLRSQPIEVISNKNIMLAAVKRHGNALSDASKELKQDKELVLEAVKQNGKALLFASKELKRDKEVVIAAMKQNIEVLNFVDEIPELWCDILNGTDKYEDFPLEIKQNEEIVLYMLIHSKYRCNIRIDESLNKERIIRELVSQKIPASDILQIIINGLSNSIIKFAIDGKLIDVPFIVANNNISVPSLSKKMPCIDIDIKVDIDTIELNDYYYLTSQSFCPSISNDTFFIILDMLSSIYKYSTSLTDLSRKLTTTPIPSIRNVNIEKTVGIDRYYNCILSKDIYALANGSLERGRKKGYDRWSGTFYDQYGFKNDKYSEIIQKYQTRLLMDYDEELYTLLNNINDYSKLELNMDTITLQECAKFIIHLCKTETKMSEMYIYFINKFSNSLNKIYAEESHFFSSVNFTKPVSKKQYSINLIYDDGDMVFNITTLSGGKKSKKRKIRKRLTYKY
jgi:hypothetical protein